MGSRAVSNRHLRRRRSDSALPWGGETSVLLLLVLSLLWKPTAAWTAPTRNAATIARKPSGLFLDFPRLFHRRRTFRLPASTEHSVDSVVPTTTTLPSLLESSSAPSPNASEAPTELPAAESLAIHEIAIVLNTNAKGVTEDTIRVAQEVVLQIEAQRKQQPGIESLPRVRLLVTSTYEEAKSASKEIAKAATTTPTTTTMIIPVGGDGTLTTMINLLWEEHKNSIVSQPLPNCTWSNHNSSSNQPFPMVFGYVAMGTGNALGSVVGCLPSFSNEHRRRRRIRRLFRRCLRPRASKKEDFGLILSQLIEAATQPALQAQLLPHAQGGLPAREELPATLDHPPVEVDVVELPLIRVRTTHTETADGKPMTNGDSKSTDDRYAFFAGLGYDSLLLQDYKDLQDQMEGKTSAPWQLATTGVIGYTVAMVTKSLPKLLALENAAKLLKDVEVTTDDPESTHWIDHRRGDTLRPAAFTKNGDSKVNDKTLLYRGSAGIVAAGTVPYYGGGLRLFPFARMTPRGMHLRIVRRLHPLEGIAKIPSVFEGSFRDKRSSTFRCLDFVGSRFAIDIYESYDCDASGTEEGFPVQHSGESLGRCTHVEFSVGAGEKERDADDDMPPPIRFVTLMPPRLVEE